VAGRRLRVHRRATVLDPEPPPAAGPARSVPPPALTSWSAAAVGPPWKGSPVVTQTIPARAWHLGDILVPSAGPARRITLHRLEGAPAHAVVQFAGITGQTHYPVEHTENIERSS